LYGRVKKDSLHLTATVIKTLTRITIKSHVQSLIVRHVKIFFLGGSAMKPVSIIVAVISLQGCLSMNLAPPQRKEIERSRTYAMDFDKTWMRAVDWFADHNVSIEKIEKTSGLLTAKYLLETNDTYLDCGQMDIKGAVEKPTIKRFGSLNVTVRSASDTATVVNVNLW
jgi:isocitrate dehydrogenase